MLISDLRQHYRQLRQKFSHSMGEESVLRLTVHMRRLIQDLATSDTQICLYQPKAEEAQFILGPKTDYFFPRLREADHTLHFYRPFMDSSFALNSYGISEPLPDLSQPLDLSLPTLVFCPAVAVDWRGRRLGMGKGYYDRFFNTHRHVVRIGVVYQVQVSKDPLPAESWDQPLDWIISEEMILRTLNRSS